jgi:IclR family acetate operon transcriptional repressor
MTTDERYLIQPFDKGLYLLEALAHAEHGLTLGELSSQIGLHRSTMFRYLQTLQRHGYLVHDRAAERYMLSAKFRDMAQQVKTYDSLRRAAGPVMESLSRRLEESLNLAVLEQKGTVLYVFSANSSHSLRIQTDQGTREPAHATASGKVMLAHLTHDDVLKHLDLPLQRCTPKTVTSLPALLRDLQDVRERGFAVNDGETIPGAYCLAVPILDAKVHPIASLSVSAPASRVNEARKAKFVTALTRAAKAIARNLKDGA